MPANLSIELLRTFVAIVDTGSMARATERVFLTQSALSQQMKRLSQTIQAPLFERSSVGLVLTPAGNSLLEHAREILELNDRAVLSLVKDAPCRLIRVGMVQDFADSVLAGVLGRFAQLNPQTRLQICVANSHELREMMTAERLEIALYLGSPDDPDAFARAQVVWVGDAHLNSEATLPIVLMEPPCVFRAPALKVLEEVGRDYRIVLETSSISVLRAAVGGGLGWTCRVPAFLGPRLPQLNQFHQPLPEIGYIIRKQPNAHPAAERLAAFLQETALEL